MTQSPEEITEKSRRVPVEGHFDVVIIGGGVSGVAAAVSAARNNARTCLIEKQHMLGGLATLGLVVIYLPLCDGRGSQVIGGLGEELLHLSVRYGNGKVPSCWANEKDLPMRKKKRFSVKFNPASFAMAMEEFVLKNGVSLIYDSRFCDTAINCNGEIEAVILENKSGRIAVTCSSVVDASGDADVAFRCGEKTVSLDTNRRSSWYFSLCSGELKLHKLGDPLYGAPPAGIPTFAGDRWQDVTQMNIESRKLIFDKLKRDEDSDSDDYPLLIPAIAQFRMTRRLSSGFELDESDAGITFPDTIGLTGDWRRSGPVFSIPYRCLTGSRIPNLLVAGRCISVTDAMWDVTRAIPACAVTGQAAGTAAAISAEKGLDVREIPAEEIRKNLKSQGAILNIPGSS